MVVVEGGKWGPSHPHWYPGQYKAGLQQWQSSHFQEHDWSSCPSDQKHEDKISPQTASQITTTYSIYVCAYNIHAQSLHAFLSGTLWYQLRPSLAAHVRTLRARKKLPSTGICTLVGQPFTCLHICSYVHLCPDMYVAPQHVNSCQRIKSYETAQLSLMRCHIQGCNTTAKYCNTYLQYTFMTPSIHAGSPFTTHHLHVVHFIEYHMCQSHKQCAHDEVSIQLTEMLIALSLLSV